MLKWKLGRQGTGYKKLKLFQFLWFDCYLLKYEVGDHIPAHVDPVPNRKHWRLNIELVRAKSGGTLVLYNKSGLPVIKKSRINLFRSDVVKHSVTKIRDGDRIVLTFGAAI